MSFGIIKKCNKCFGTGMFDILSSIPCDCMSKKNTLNRIVRLKMKAVKEERWDDTKLLRAIEKKLTKQLNQ